MNYENNGAFSTSVPMLQLAWDSTSIGLLKECPRKYFFSMVLGAAPRYESIHLTFGIHYHSGLEKYDHLRAQGVQHEEAMLQTLRYLLAKTWDTQLGRPWHSDDTNKNRTTLIRSVIWYLDQFQDDPFETVILDNGKPAVELSFKLQSDHYTSDGTSYILCGHIDRLATVPSASDHTYILDHKTTKNTINQDFFDKFTPDNQFSLYSFAAKIVYNKPVQGVIVNAAQIAVNFTRFLRGPAERTTEFLTEWYNDLGYHLKYAEEYARSQYWPANDKSCGNYGGCPFRDICSKSPSMRMQWLKMSFVTRRWDPTISRGDI